MNELMFQAGVKGMSERSELIPCINYLNNEIIWGVGKVLGDNKYQHVGN